jgi:hypothetical protein
MVPAAPHILAAPQSPELPTIFPGLGSPGARFIPQSNNPIATACPMQRWLTAHENKWRRNKMFTANTPDKNISGKYWGFGGNLS